MVDPRENLAHDLAVAQLEAHALAVERLDSAYASLERRLDRIAGSLATVESPAGPAVSVGQLRLVGGM